MKKIEGAASDGEAYESNDVEGIWTAGINLPFRPGSIYSRSMDPVWNSRIECHGESKEDAEELRDAVLEAITQPPAPAVGDAKCTDPNNCRRCSEDATTPHAGIPRTAVQIAAPDEGEQFTDHGDWYTDNDTGTHIFDLDDDSDRLLSILLQCNGKVGFAIRVEGVGSWCGNATDPIFRTALAALGQAKPQTFRLGTKNDPGFKVAAPGDVEQEAWTLADRIEFALRDAGFTEADAAKYTAAALRSQLAEAPGDVARLQRAYWLGWRNSAAWADRKDLWADADSPAYMQERDDDLGTLSAALRSQGQAEAVVFKPGDRVIWTDSTGMNAPAEGVIREHRNDCYWIDFDDGSIASSATANELTAALAQQANK